MPKGNRVVQPRKKLNRDPLETGIYAAIMRDKSVAEAFVGKSCKGVGSRGLAELVQKKVKKLPNYKLMLICSNLVLYRQGTGTFKTYADVFDV